MRVLHVIPAIAPRYGGPSAATLGMCRALHARGVETLIATTDADGPGRLRVTLGQPSTYDGLQAIFFRRRLTESFKWSGDLRAWLASQVSEFDVVHVHAVFSHSSIAAGRACIAAGVPHIVRPLGTLDPWSVNRKAMRKRVLFQLGGDAMLRRAAAIHYTTAEEQRLAESVVKNLPRGVVVPLGIDEPFFADVEHRPAAPPYVLGLSRLEAKKGCDLLIRSFHACAGARDDWRLVIAGDGEPEYVASLKQLAGTGPAAARIEFRGWVTGSEKIALLRQASVFALSSHQENFGIALVEAMAVGVPALVTPGVNLAADIERAHAGWVVAHAEDDLARGLAHAMSHTEDREARGRHARAFAAQFRWPRVADELMVLYDSLVPNATPIEHSAARRLA